MRWVILTVVMILAACVPPMSHDASGDPILINFDSGGDLGERIRLVEQYARSGREVQIVGACTSACLMHLYYDNTCVHETSTFGFHRPSLYDPGRSDAEEAMALMIEIYSNYLPGRLKDWYLAGPVNSTSIVWISATELRRIEPSIRLCNT